jgi:hypothetical protein
VLNGVDRISMIFLMNLMTFDIFHSAEFHSMSPKTKLASAISGTQVVGRRTIIAIGACCLAIRGGAWRGGHTRESHILTCNENWTR